MVLDRLGRALHGALKKVTKSTHVDEQAIKELARDIQRALLQADVNVQMVLGLTKRIEKRALDEKLPPGASRKEQIIRIVYEELSAFMGKPAKFEVKPGSNMVVLMVGLQGGGKTTSIAKLASHFQKRGLKAGIICADIYRPGAYEQVQQLGEQAGVRIHGDPKAKDAIKLALEGVKKFQDAGLDLIFVDSAGRHRKEGALMKEVKEIAKKVKPDEVILVIDGTLGQQVKDQAVAFNEATDVGSIIVTKLDGTAKGGGALSAVAATGAPIKFIGTGEKLGEIEPFVPERFVSRMLGMGDIETLLQKIKEVSPEEEMKPEDLKAIMSGKISLRDVYDQLEKVSKMGPLKKFLQMLPGVGMSIPEEDMQVGEEKMKRFKVIMQSMTSQELDDPRVLKSSRIKRIAQGSGTTEKDVKELLKQYDMMRKLIKQMVKGRGAKLGPLGKMLKQMPKDMQEFEQG